MSNNLAIAKCAGALPGSTLDLIGEISISKSSPARHTADVVAQRYYADFMKRRAEVIDTPIDWELWSPLFV